MQRLLAGIYNTSDGNLVQRKCGLWDRPLSPISRVLVCVVLSVQELGGGRTDVLSEGGRSWRFGRGVVSFVR